MSLPRLLLAAVLGVAHTQAYAPHTWWWLQLLSLAGLGWRWSPNAPAPAAGHDRLRLWPGLVPPAA
ncbi:hypothetical protein ACU4GD_44585 [Cupriavidus basilensis]